MRSGGCGRPRHRLGTSPRQDYFLVRAAEGVDADYPDKDFGHVRNYPPANYAGIVVLDLRDDAVAAEILRILRAFLGQTAILARLPGRLTIVEAGRIRLRTA